MRLDLTDHTTWSAAFAGVRTMFLLRPPQTANVRPSSFTQNLAQVHGAQVREHDELLVPARR